MGGLCVGGGCVGCVCVCGGVCVCVCVWEGCVGGSVCVCVGMGGLCGWVGVWVCVWVGGCTMTPMGVIVHTKDMISCNFDHTIFGCITVHKGHMSAQLKPCLYLMYYLHVNMLYIITSL